MWQWLTQLLKRNPTEIIGALSKQGQEEIDHVYSEKSKANVEDCFEDGRMTLTNFYQL